MTTRNGLLALAALLALETAPAAEKSFDVDAELAAGYQYDSNVGYTDIDSLSGAADTAMRLRAGLTATAKRGRAMITAGYEFDSTAYAEQEGFDLDLHHATGGIAGSFAGYEIGITADHLEAVREQGPYLELSQMTPSVGRLFGRSVYARLGYTVGSKAYADLPTRAADHTALRGDVYLLLDGMRRYVAFNFRRVGEDAVDPALDYEAVAGSLTLGHSLTGARRAPSLKAELGYEARDYRTLTASIDSPRRDRRLNAGLILVLPLNEHLELQAEAARTRNDSNLPDAAFDRTSACVTLTATF
jgi:hypothetical protein